MRFFVSLLVNGALDGAIYALIALAFVVVYKATRMMNFALGEWVTVSALLVALGLHVLDLGLAIAMVFACGGMVALAVLFSGLVLRRMIMRPPISLIMVTIGLGALMRGAAALLFRGIPVDIQLPIAAGPLAIFGVSVPAEKVAAAALAVLCVTVVAGFYHRTRSGIALRAIADDQQAAAGAGIDIQRHFAIVWAIAGAVLVVAGVLWTVTAGGGFGMALVGLKVFPIVVIGGLDSIRGTLVAALLVGTLESLAAGYLDPLLGAGFADMFGYVALVAMLFARPYGLFGRPAVERV